MARKLNRIYRGRTVAEGSKSRLVALTKDATTWVFNETVSVDTIPGTSPLTFNFTSGYVNSDGYLYRHFNKFEFSLKTLGHCGLIHYLPSNEYLSVGGHKLEGNGVSILFMLSVQVYGLGTEERWLQEDSRTISIANDATIIDANGVDVTTEFLAWLDVNAIKLGENLIGTWFLNETLSYIDDSSSVYKCNITGTTVFQDELVSFSELYLYGSNTSATIDNYVFYPQIRLKVDDTRYILFYGNLGGTDGFLGVVHRYPEGASVVGIGRTDTRTITITGGDDVDTHQLVSYIKANATKQMPAGLFDENDNLVASWDELVNTYGLDVEKDYSPETHLNDKANLYYILSNNSELVIGVKLIMPNNITKIGQYALANCTNLTNIVIPDSVIGIDNGAFSRCTSLTNIIIPDSVTSVGSDVFSRCTSLKSVVIGDSVTSIGEYTFRECTSLTSAVIGNSVTSIGHNTFNHCESLTNIVIPDSVTKIGNYAFTYCTSLTSVVIPNSVTSIGNHAFSYCSYLTSIEISNSVTNMGSDPFFKCDQLVNINFDGTVAQWNAITKDNYDYWGDYFPATYVQCTDGQVAL